MNIPEWYDKLREKTYLQIFTIYTRYLIGGAFFIAAIGMGKLNGSSNLVNSMNKPIQNLQPIQQFFRVMAESGMYWQFIGWSQIVTGILLITQRFSRLGAILFFGLILNIFIITISYNFEGTPFITGLMLLASIYLLVWDIRAFLPLLTTKEIKTSKRLPIIEHSYWALLGILMVISIVLAFIFKLHTLYQLAFPFTIGLIGFILFTMKRKNMN